MEDKQKNKIEVNFIRLAEIVKADWRVTGLYCLLAAILGVIVAFSIPRIYKTSVMLAPETSSASSLTSNISSLASMVGMDMNFGDNNDAIYPEIYPDLMKSTDFLVSMFPVKVKSIDGDVNTTYYDYIAKMQKFPWWDYPKVWIAKLAKSLKKSSDANRGNGDTVNPFMLTKEQFEVAQGINKNIDCSVDKKTSVISIEVTDQDPLIAASVADSVKDRLQVYITKYRTNKARNDLAYMEELFDEAKAQYTKARQQYAAYADANQDLILQSYKSKEEDLENEMQLRYNIYTQVTEQLQLAKAKVQERTPAFTVVQSATVPVRHSNKPKVIVLGMFMFLGIALRVLILMYQRRNEIFTTTA